MIEGLTPLPFDADASHAGPGTRDAARPFYNPAMAVNRDLSVLLVDAWAAHRGRQLDVADVLAGAGARSLRLANEAAGDIVVHANDGDPGAISSIEAGRAALGIPEARLVAARGNAHAFLATRRFDVVDVDPYGSPAPFLDAAVRATRHGGLVCLTATDTAALSGTYPRVCRRRYGAWHGLHQMPWRAEVGLRILAAAAIRAAGRHDRAARPVLSVSRAHWMRVVLEVRDGRGAADKAARGLGFVHGDAHRMAHVQADATALPTPWAGPLWTGPLHDEALVAAMAKIAGPVQGGTKHAAGRDATRPSPTPSPISPASSMEPSPFPRDVLKEPARLANTTRRLLERIVAEARAPAFWASMPHLRAAVGHDLPRREVLMAALRDGGHMAAPSHMDPEGIRTDADWSALIAAT